ncbi:MAG: ribbon-helix-helix protein, CopG family [Thermofilum sp.]|uniref:ribbon-helix-helix protein, CopG family n=1 Tax=Thermofilum sp. TaxID=1961369 RepID=UPI0025888832|nr:ribbon-helix-helix protein, CopG family [Thermofilum sp.]MCI4408466.1 ribbon-helix-helix protein, CopG family [Thermofilum sp.]
MSDEKEIICFMVDQEMKKYLEAEAKAQGKSLSKLVREIILEYIIESEQTKSE